MPSHNQSTNRSKQKQITRQKLLDATIDIIAEEGLVGVTMAKVAERTQLSRGICNFHFDTKEHLMLEAFRMLYQEHELAWREALSDLTESPTSRLSAFLKTLLLPPIADHKKVAVWMAFWGVAPHRQTYLEICASIDREYEAEVERLLRELSGGKKTVHGQSLHAIAVTLTCMIDGFWVNYLISPGGCLAPEDAINACLVFLSKFFPELDSLLLPEEKDSNGN
ncbi:MAG: TetR family transcriptional regulator [Desulforhopalus sp.]|nr:TetR family transcriptional regulator [Desulforhopalus sp.]